MLSTVSLLYACGGGGGGGGGSDGASSSDDSGGDSVSVSGLNPELPGRFLFSYDWHKHTDSRDDRMDGGLIMDIKTGSYTEIPNTNWADMFKNDGHEGVWHTRAIPIKNSSSMFLVQSENTFEYTDGSLEPYFLAYQQDFYGNLLDDLYIFPYNADSDIQMSSDANYLALFSNGFLRVLQVTSTALTTVDKREYSVSPFSWLSDNRLIVVSEDGRSFVITSVLSTDAETTIPLPDDLTGRIIEMVVSSDDMRIAFIVQEDSGDEAPWVMNIDGSGLRQLAESVDSGGAQKFGKLQWSPNDAYIMVQEPFLNPFLGDDISVAVVPTSRYVIPSLDSGEVYKTAEDAQLRSPDVIRLKFLCDNPQDEECEIKYDVESNIYWVP
jgi:hypothetical protein